MKPRKPMPKLKRIGKPAALKIVGTGSAAKASASLERIYPSMRPKFFRVRGRNVLAVGTAQALGLGCFETKIGRAHV